MYEKKFANKQLTETPLRVQLTQVNYSFIISKAMVPFRGIIAIFVIPLNTLEKSMRIFINPKDRKLYRLDHTGLYSQIMGIFQNTQ